MSALSRGDALLRDSGTTYSRWNRLSRGTLQQLCEKYHLPVTRSSARQPTFSLKRDFIQALLRYVCPALCIDKTLALILFHKRESFWCGILPKIYCTALMRSQSEANNATEAMQAIDPTHAGEATHSFGATNDVEATE
jgi:hypothetical protein